MTDTIIENTDVWNITSHGNGASYTITHKPTMRTLFVQYGDDAIAFREHYEAMEVAYMTPGTPWNTLPWNACLGAVAEHAGYGLD